MTAALRWYFLAFYAVGLTVLIVKVVPQGRKDGPIENRPGGPWVRAATLLLPFEWVLPPALILLRVGELPLEWYPIRLLGFAFSFYAAVLQLWASATLGRFLVPYVAIFKDHELVTGGPFRFVRHPIYSGNVALFLGAALGTLNLYLLALWPVYVAGIATHARFEERFLRIKFGAAYEAYAKQAGLLIPRFRQH